MNFYVLKQSLCSSIRLHVQSKSKLLYKQCHIQSHEIVRNFNTTITRQNPDMDYSIEEITIPNGTKNNYNIACKVWRWKGDDRNLSKAKNEPPIICVHGWLDNANSFDTLIPKIIRPNRTFYALDLPGHGLSSHIRTTHYSGHVDAHLAIHRVVRHLKFNKFTLLGHSMGAEGCIMYAASFPEGVHKVVAIDGVNPKPTDWVQSVALFAHSLFEIEDTLERSPEPEPSTYEELLGRMMRARDDVVFEEGCRILLARCTTKVKGLEDKYRFTHDLKLKIYPGMAMMETDQMAQFFSGVQAPLCVIKSSRNDRFSEQASHDFVTAMENAKSDNGQLDFEFHTAEGTHHVHLNDPSKVANIIDTFLSK